METCLAHEPKRISNRLEHGPLVVSPQDAIPLDESKWFHDRYLFTDCFSWKQNVISPGHIDTPIMESLQQGEALTRMKKEMEINVLLGRLGEPDEIAKAVSFLASDEASYVAGTELYVDGGVAQI